MTKSTILFVHGTGVRSESYSRTLELIESKVRFFHLPCRVESCPWGDVHGIDFDGLSLPAPPERNPEEVAQADRWEYLQVDPLFDLRLWCLPADEPRSKVLGAKNSGAVLWEETVSRYTVDLDKKVELIELLHSNGIKDFFALAWVKVVNSGLPQKAFAGAGGDAPAVSCAFAEAVVAQMMHDAADAAEPVPLSPRTASKIVTVLLLDWNQRTKGMKDLFLRFFGMVTKTVVRPLRARTSKGIAPAIGDILLYQAKGREIRRLIRAKIESISGDIFVLAHSLGGIACFELMVEARRDGEIGLGAVKGLITVGSQAPLFFEFDALETLKKGAPLPPGFPKWLNLYDENDLLSYRANRLFNIQPDRQVDSMLPPLQAHSAYWTLDETWKSIALFVEQTNG